MEMSVNFWNVSGTIGWQFEQASMVPRGFITFIAGIPFCFGQDPLVCNYHIAQRLQIDEMKR